MVNDTATNMVEAVVTNTVMAAVGAGLNPLEFAVTPGRETRLRHGWLTTRPPTPWGPPPSNFQ